MDWQKNILSALFVLVSVILNAQDIKVRKKHEIGVDAANILTFIKKLYYLLQLIIKKILFFSLFYSQ